MLDVDLGKFIDANENALHLFRMPRQDLLNRHPVEMSPPAQADGVPSWQRSQELIEKALQGESPTFDWLHCSSAGEIISCEVRLVRLPTASRRLVRASIVDISKRKAAEEELRRAREASESALSELKRTEQSLRTERELMRNLIEVQEQEKQFLYHEFHDGLIQNAVGSLMSLSSYQNRHPASEAADTISTAIKYLSQGVEDGRRALRGIRPAVLDDFGLDAAMDDLIDQYSNTGMLATCKHDHRIGRLPSSIETTVY